MSERSETLRDEKETCADHLELAMENLEHALAETDVWRMPKAIEKQIREAEVLVERALAEVRP